MRPRGGRVSDQTGPIESSPEGKHEKRPATGACDLFRGDGGDRAPEEERAARVFAKVGGEQGGVREA